MKPRTIISLFCMAFLASACTTIGTPPADTSFSIVDVSVTLKSGATDRSTEQVTPSMVETVKTSALQYAKSKGKTGPAKRLEVSILQFVVPSRAGSLVSQEHKEVMSDVRVVDVATGTDEGRYLSSVRAPMNIWTADAEQKAGFEIAHGAGMVIIDDAYKAGRKPAE